MIITVKEEDTADMITVQAGLPNQTILCVNHSLRSWKHIPCQQKSYQFGVILTDIREQLIGRILFLKQSFPSL